MTGSRSSQQIMEISNAIRRRAMADGVATDIRLSNDGESEVLTVRPVHGDGAPLTIYLHVPSGALTGDFGADSRLEHEIERDPPASIAAIAQALFRGDVEEWLDRDGQRIAASEGRVGSLHTKHFSSRRAENPVREHVTYPPYPTA